METGAHVKTGSALALVSAVVFALNVSCVPLIYDGGGNIHAINLVRPLAFFAFIAVWTLLARRSLALPATQLAGAVLLGGIMCLEFYALHAAVKFIPVGLAVLVMYTYPLIVALLTALFGRGRLTVWLVLVLMVTFAGLMLALAAPVVALDWRGVALALGASAGMCAIVFLGETTMEGYESTTIMFYATLVASAIMVALLASGVPFAFPDTPMGVAAISVATTAYVVATALLFVTITMIGPLRFAVIDNTAPVWATLLGIALLGETPSPMQWVGMFVVVGGVIAVQVMQKQA